MRRFDLKRAFGFIVAIFILALLPLQVLAKSKDNSYTNDDTGYEAYIDDSENLLEDYEISDVLSSMKSLTDEGNVVFVTTSLRAGQAESFAEDYYQDRYGTKEPGIIFLIDMGDRLLLLQAHNGLDYKITSGKANSIVDNVYTYAGDKDYAKCAESVFQQCGSVLAGLRIAQPFKYISSIFIAIILAFLLGFFILWLITSATPASNKEIINGLFSQLNILNRNAEKTSVSKRYSPQSSGSSGGGGGGHHSGGGGGGGGHHSSGSHHF
ncbi:MAG: TPM domain-containing protein [Lachnospiraceae bacterium]|nr:TPM domain-containing protein [Lachnospiraceae bacterium]